MIPIVSFVGKSNSGKTTLLEKVVRELKMRGYRVAVVKHSPHGFDIDHPGKDSWRFVQAGSDVVALSSSDKVVFFERLNTELTLAQIGTLFDGKVDIVLTEGYKNGKAPKILVMAAGQDGKEICGADETLATVSARLSSPGMPQFAYDDVIRVLDLLVAQIGKKSPGNLSDTLDASYSAANQANISQSLTSSSVSPSP